MKIRDLDSGLSQLSCIESSRLNFLLCFLKIFLHTKVLKCKHLWDPYGNLFSKLVCVFWLLKRNILILLETEYINVWDNVTLLEENMALTILLFVSLIKALIKSSCGGRVVCLFVFNPVSLIYYCFCCPTRIQNILPICFWVFHL